MDKDIIISTESANDGKSVYLYFNDEVGFYSAYGLSAFFVSHLVDPVISYSAGLGLPVVLINRCQIMELRRSLSKKEHIEHKFYHFTLKRMIGKTGYDAWVEKSKSSL